jgi:hypothetical protein
MGPDPTKKQKTYSMNNKIQKNYAFVDSQNVNLSIRNQGWVLKLLKLMIPNRDRFSSLFRKLMSYIVFMNDLKEKLEYTRQ